MAISIPTPKAPKLNAIILAYRNGQRKEAAEKVRRLTKRELMYLLCGNHQLQDGFAGDGPGNYDFECFVDRALDGYGE